MVPIAVFPERSPLAVVEAIKDIIIGRSVCDIGCGEGDVLELMSAYAKSIVGLDIDRNRYQHAVSRGIKVHHLDYLQCEYPVAEVYYTWPQVPWHCSVIVERLKDQQPTAIILVGGRPNADHLKALAVQYKGQIIPYRYNESGGTYSAVFPAEGLFWVVKV